MKDITKEKILSLLALIKEGKGIEQVARANGITVEQLTILIEQYEETNERD